MTTTPVYGPCQTHGRLSCAECGVIPKPRILATVERAEQLVDLMETRGLRRLVFEDASTGEHLEFEAWRPFSEPGAPEKPARDPATCACGHGFVEHTDAGCGHGCDAVLCNTTEAKP